MEENVYKNYSGKFDVVIKATAICPMCHKEVFSVYDNGNN